MRLSRLLAALALLITAVAPMPAEEVAKSLRLETTAAKPKAYAIQDYSITTVPAIAFYPAFSSEVCSAASDLGRRGPTNTVMRFYAPLQLPDGVIIDYVGLNSKT